MSNTYQQSWEQHLRDLEQLKDRIDHLEKIADDGRKVLKEVEERLITEMDPIDGHSLRSRKERLKQQINDSDSELLTIRKKYRNKVNSCYKEFYTFLIQKEQIIFLKNGCCLNDQNNLLLNKFQKKYKVADSDAASIREQVIQSHRQQAQYVRAQNRSQEGWNGYVISGIALLLLIVVGAALGGGGGGGQKSDGWIFLGRISAPETSGDSLNGKPLGGTVTIENPIVPSQGDVVAIIRPVNLRTEAGDETQKVGEVPNGDEVLIIKVTSLFDPKDNLPGTEEVWAEIQHCKNPSCNKPK